MILYELMTFQAPFPVMNMMQVTAQLLQGRTPIIPSHCNEDIALLIKQCWDQQPANLPGIHTILVQLEKIMEGKLGKYFCNNKISLLILLQSNHENKEYSCTISRFEESK